jgi:hypothetical protein
MRRFRILMRRQRVRTVDIAVLRPLSRELKFMSTESRAVMFLPILALALSLGFAHASPAAFAKETTSTAVPMPRPLLRNSAGEIVDPVFGPPVPGQSMVG